MGNQTLDSESELTRSSGRRRAMAPLAGVAACLLLAALVVNPLREMIYQDDSWAYARSVEHLIRTGEYRLDAWSAANMPVQIYLAGALSKIVGYSLSLLRLATVGLLALGLASFYGLAREIGAERRTSLAATLALLASPLVLRLGFTFMTDIQFMGWMLAALFLYVRGLRHHNGALVFMGSIAAACAIGTRQFGLAIVVGLLVACVLCRPEDRPSLRTLVLAAGLPAGAVGWQILMGVQEPNFTQSERLWQEHVYLSQPPAILAQDFLWRAAMALQYVGISVLPALPLLVGAGLACAGQARLGARRLILLATLIGLALCAVLLVGGPLTGRLDRPHGLWPPLGLWWFLGTDLPVHLYRPLDLAGLAAAAALGAVALFGARGLRSMRRNSVETILLVAIPACLFGLHLFYVQFTDTYTVQFVPFALLLLAVQSRGSILTPGLAAVSTGVSVAGLMLVSLWTRANFAEEETFWAAADRLTREGVPAAEIYELGTCNTWPAYHGAFDDWLAAGKPGHKLFLERVGHDISEPWGEWLDMRGQHAAYRIQSDPLSQPGWQLIAGDSYLDFAFQRREVFTYRAVEATTAVK